MCFFCSLQYVQAFLLPLLCCRVSEVPPLRPEAKAAVSRNLPARLESFLRCKHPGSSLPADLRLCQLPARLMSSIPKFQNPKPQIPSRFRHPRVRPLAARPPALHGRPEVPAVPSQPRLRSLMAGAQCHSAEGYCCGFNEDQFDGLISVIW